jgi:hypothetical protein
MIRLHRRALALALVLAAGPLAPSMASAAAPTTELRVPDAVSPDASELLAKITEAMSPELRAAFRAVAADALGRHRASKRAAANGEGEVISVEQAARAALLAADFGDVSKTKSKVVDALVSITVIQVLVDLHDALRERTGRQLAIRAVRACKGSVSCLDAIAPTTDMPAKHIAAVRKDFEGKAKDLEAEDRLGNFEIQDLTSSYEQTTQTSRVKSSDKQAKAVLDFIKG